MASKEDKAVALYKQGKSISVIASKLLVPERIIERWVKPLAAPNTWFGKTKATDRSRLHRALDRVLDRKAAKDAFTKEQKENIKKYGAGGHGPHKYVHGSDGCKICSLPKIAAVHQATAKDAEFVPSDIPMNYKTAAKLAVQEARSHQSEGKRLRQVSGSLRPEVQKAAQAHFNAVGSWEFVINSLRLRTDQGEETAEELWPSAVRASAEADQLTQRLGNLQKAKDAPASLVKKPIFKVGQRVRLPRSTEGLRNRGMRNDAEGVVTEVFKQGKGIGAEFRYKVNGLWIDEELLEAA